MAIRFQTLMAQMSISNRTISFLSALFHSRGARLATLPSPLPLLLLRAS
jgi:hypothetical protein